MASIRNERKLDAIIGIARHVYGIGFGLLKQRILDDPINELQKLPYIGPVTAWHLAKNLGLDVAKPDRHLVRLSGQLGYKEVHDLCASIAAATGNPVSVVDIILWRYLADRSAPDAKKSVRADHQLGTTAWPDSADIKPDIRYPGRTPALSEQPASLEPRR